MRIYAHLAITVCDEVNVIASRAHFDNGVLWEEKLRLDEVDDVLHDIHFVAEDGVQEDGSFKDVIGHAYLHTWRQDVLKFFQLFLVV